ncbi:MAG: cysteine--tRNA ligase [Verrucomicrobiaceae bacterium]|nr:cysteine--tRNA ligase [Verrucomicrobiaceae bacterium]
MALMIYNTLTRSKELFTPIEPGKIRMYVCGMTVYDYCHLGHARVLVAFDVITRYLRSRDYDVTYVRNITDIDDKILRRAAENGEQYESLTARFIDAMHEDEKRLGVLPPSQEPRATQHIGDIIALIEKLIAKDYAYRASNGDVYYAVSKFEGYGKLSGKKPDELLAGARVEVDEAKRDPRDFALWKAAKPQEEAVWDSPWGAGRPGWHIECSAMSGCCLGDTFDIHGGGPDLRFPHHENEIAQSEAATGKHYVNYWMHAGAVRVDGEKMSKSLGNFFTIREILDKYDAEVVRYLLIGSHYRSEIDYSQESLQEAKSGLDRFYNALKEFSDIAPATAEQLQGSSFHDRFIAAMDDDFNTREALSAMYDLVRALNAENDTARKADLAAQLKALGAMFGILQRNPSEWFKNARSVNVFVDGIAVVANAPQGRASAVLDEQAIELLITERLEARKLKNFVRSDEIRDQLKAQGVVLEDSTGKTTWRRE